MSLHLLPRAYASEKHRKQPLLPAQSNVTHRTRTHPLLRLQQTIGNRAVQGLIQTKRLGAEPGYVLQPRLMVGAAHDHYEQEADAVAQRVMTMPAPAAPSSIQRQGVPEEKDKERTLQTKPLTDSITPFLQREMMPEEEKEKPVQAKFSVQRTAGVEDFDSGADLEARLSRSQGGGSALPDHVRSYMEPRFGVNFSGVRVHTDHEAAQMNQTVGAQAFTHGQDIYFGAGKAPGISDLMAHELTHVVQQTGYRAFHHQRMEVNHTCPTCAKMPQLSHACPSCQERQVVQRLTSRQECDRLRGSCNWFCTKRHLWLFPPDVSGWLNCRKNFCDSCYRKCLNDGTFPCVF
ncbi:MAG: hypothetical protein NTNFB02_23140 [Nitrospira sp.]